MTSILKMPFAHKHILRIIHDEGGSTHMNIKRQTRYTNKKISEVLKDLKRWGYIRAYPNLRDMRTSIYREVLV